MDEFIYRFPVFLLRDSSGILVTAEFGDSIGVVITTDTDVAFRFAEAHGVPNPQPIPIASPQELARFLGALKGVQEVVFDPGEKGLAKHRFALSDAVAQLNST